MCKLFCMYENRYYTQNNLDLIAVSCCPQNRGLQKICQFLTYRNVKQQDQQRQYFNINTYRATFFALPFHTTYSSFDVLYLAVRLSITSKKNYFSFTLQRTLRVFLQQAPANKILKMKIKLYFILYIFLLFLQLLFLF